MMRTARHTAAVLRLLRPLARAAALCVLLLGCLRPALAASETFAAGSIVIDMGVQPQSYANGLKPYGLLQQLVITQQIPVSWVINPLKGQNGIDFSHNGKDYRGGPFIIPAAFAAQATPVIQNWVSTRGLSASVINTTVGPVTVPVFETLTVFPRAVLDNDNGSIAAGYLVNAGVDPSFYRLDTPAGLNSCDDVYTMPHADPIWSTHNNLIPFNAQGGFIWAACHAVSVMENVDDPADAGTAPNMNFLTNNGAIDFGSHSDGTPPYTHASFPDPVMQFLGSIDAATLSGSENIYLPAAAGWRNSTTIAVWDPDHPQVGAGQPSPGKAAVIAYGRGFGVGSNGMVMYEAGHTHNQGDNPPSVAAQRAYLNFLLMTGIERRPLITASIPATVKSLEVKNLDATVVGGLGGPYNYFWTSSCGGSFSDPNAPNPTFTAPATDVDLACILRVTVWDTCTRRTFTAGEVTVLGKPNLAITKTDSQDPVALGGTLSYVLNVVNYGSIATNVTVTDVLPPEVSYVSAVPNTGSCSHNAGTVSCNLGTLATAATASVTVTVTAPAYSMTLSNTASVSSDDADLNPADNSATETTRVRPQIDLALAKSVAPATVNTGSPAIFSLTVTNRDVSRSATSLTVTDTLPAGLQYQSTAASGWLCTYTAATRKLSCQLASLGPGASSVINVTVIPLASGTHINNASVASADFAESNIADNSDTASLLALAAADLAIVKTTDNLPAGDGNVLTFFLDVTNNGPDPAANVVVTDTLTFSNNKANASGYKDFYNFTKYFFTFPDGTRIQGGTTVRQVTHNGLTIAVSYNPATTNPLNNAQPNPVPADGTPVTISWSISPQLAAGKSVRLEFEAKKVSDIRAPNTAAVTSGTTDPTAANNSDSILVGKKTAGGATISYADLEVKKAAALNPLPTNNPVAVVTQVNAQANFSYLLAVRNLGPTAIPRGDATKGYSKVTIIDTLPVGVTYLGFAETGTDVAHSLPNGVLVAAANVDKGSWSCSYDAPSRVLTCTYTLDQGDNLNSGAYTEGLLIRARAPNASGTITNTANQLSFTVPPAVSANAWIDPYDNNDQASWTLNILPLQVDLNVAKTVDIAAPAAIGDEVTFTVTVTNNNAAYPNDATAVVIYDPLPAGLTLVSRTLSQGSYSGSDWLLGSLAWGNSATMTITASIDVEDPVTNIASLTGLVQQDAVAGNNTASATVDIPASGALVSGTVWSDDNHDGVRNGGEAGIPGVTVVLYNSGAPSCVSTQTDASGNYSFSAVADGNYQLIEAAGESVPSPATCPSTPADPAEHVSTTANSIPIAVAGGADHANRDFGDFHGSRVEGRVFEDNGSGGATAHDGNKGNGERGLSGIAVEAGNGATLDSTLSDADGRFVLWIPQAAAGANVDILGATPGSHVAVSKADGGAGDSAAATAYGQISLVPVSGQVYNGLAFGKAREPAFAPDHSRSASPGSTLYYPHTFTAYTSGSVSFSTPGLVATPAVPGWSAVLYDDGNCSGTLEQGEALHAAAIALDADSNNQACLIARVFVPASAPASAQYAVTLAASFSYAATSLITGRNRTDLTTVGDSSLLLVKVVDKPTAQPGELLTYTITYSNAGSDALSSIVIDDNTPGFTTFSSAGCVLPLPANLTGCSASTQPAIGATGPIQWTFNPGDTLQSGGSGQVQFQVTVDN